MSEEVDSVEGRPASFASAGSDVDLHDAYLRSQMERRRDAAQSLLIGARRFSSSSNVATRRHAERDARQALGLLARSLDWAEDTPDEEVAHRLLDEAGEWVRRTFGCHLSREGNTYKQTCPVALAHNRIGMSVGGVARRTCSLCGGDVSECEHLPGTAYLVPGGAADLGWCRVCLKESCDHSPDQEYRVSVVSIIREMAIDEVSIVSKPAHPEARFSAIGIPIADLVEALGDAFEPGVDVSCDRCLLPCDGLTRHEIPHG